MAKKPILRMHEQIIPIDNNKFKFKIGDKLIGDLKGNDAIGFILNVNNQSVFRSDLRDTINTMRSIHLCKLADSID
jgi:hypothetical protein